MRKVGLAVALCALAASGCIDSMIMNGEIAATRKASTALDTVADLELAKTAAQAGLAQFEGMHKLAPDNEDALFMLMQTWGAYAWGFVEDEMEEAQDRDDEDAAEYHKKRAKLAYGRAIAYGVELLGKRAPGFEQASKNDKALTAWLQENFPAKEDAENLFWFGYAWVSRVNLLKDDPAAVADLYVGVDVIEHSVKLDPDFYWQSGKVALAAYHARTADAEVKQAKSMFDEALAKTERKSLVVQLTYAQNYACVMADKPLYEKLLGEVLAADDPDPAQRLTNAIAKRRAKRYLSKRRMQDCGFDAPK